ncbi:DUF4180 domain-containing protein [Flavobacterium piscis]|uniref:DUF4180 domain-containing protein n=1 Tax=Flavobacterium piscis TaxID=1114874 RepID=A0ABU1Y7D8_9FLAO|nr:DUF4180 domain-containing protein [Flavobacterium piscis]MDR7210147.1 hypothetical protein [Flavobacterium piscis]
MNFAGEMLQKFSNFRVRLVIVGDFEKYQSKSIRDFIFESNNGRQINFTATLNEGLKNCQYNLPAISSQDLHSSITARAYKNTSTLI